MMDKIEKGLEARLKELVTERIDLIVRVSDDPVACQPRLESRGFQVRRLFQLVSALAVTGQAADALALAGEPWVLRVEEDKPVRTM
jgi:hypothetical protein